MNTLKDASLVPSVHGHSQFEVIDALRERRDALERGVAFDDGRKIALVLEGGGLRAAGSAGAIVRLGELGYLDTFDEIYATSAGVMNAAYFLSEQERIGITIYHDDLIKREFLNSKRFWKIMDLDWVFSEVVERSKRLDLNAIMRARPAFFTAATDFDTGAPVLFDVKQSESSILDTLKGAMAIPILYNKTVTISGRRCFDGGLLNPFPIMNAIDRGCTHALVLLSRSADYVRNKTNPFMSWLFDHHFAKRNKNLRGMFARYPRIDREHRDLVLGRTQAPEGVRIATLCSPNGCRLERDTTDRELLIRSGLAYGEQVDLVLQNGGSR